MKIFPDNPQSIGNTPLVRLNKVIEGGKVYAKIEARNPAFSVKCRLGSALIWDAEEKKILTPGQKSLIVEPSSGNTGIALASVAAARGYRLIITMPETMSLERRQVMGFLGAEVVLTEGATGMAGAIAKAREIVDENPGAYMPGQFENPIGPIIHAKTTGPEIWADTDGQVEIFIAGVGTGGTFSGTGQFLKSKNPNIINVAVEPAASPVIAQKLAGKTLSPAPHQIQGIGAGFIPPILDLSLIDEVVGIDNDEAFEYAKRLARQEGILAGISSGAAVAAAARLAAKAEYADKKMVVILPDLGERYLSSSLFGKQGVRPAP